MQLSITANEALMAGGCVCFVSHWQYQSLAHSRVSLAMPTHHIQCIEFASHGIGNNFYRIILLLFGLGSCEISTSKCLQLTIETYGLFKISHAHFAQMSWTRLLRMGPISCLADWPTIRSRFKSTASMGTRLITSRIRTGGELYCILHGCGGNGGWTEVVVVEWERKSTHHARHRRRGLLIVKMEKRGAGSSCRRERTVVSKGPFFQPVDDVSKLLPRTCCELGLYLHTAVIFVFFVLKFFSPKHIIIRSLVRVP